MIYAGQEARADHHPDLFNTDKVDWSLLEECEELSTIISTISALKKKESIFVNGSFTIFAFWEFKGYKFSVYAIANHWNTIICHGSIKED